MRPTPAASWGSGGSTTRPPAVPASGGVGADDRPGMVVRARVVSAVWPGVRLRPRAGVLVPLATVRRTGRAHLSALHHRGGQPRAAAPGAFPVPDPARRLPRRADRRPAGERPPTRRVTDRRQPEPEDLMKLRLHGTPAEC